MSAFRHFSKKILFGVKTNINSQLSVNSVICLRFLSYTPMYYDGKTDPGPIFVKKEVQSLLKTLTRTDFAKVFRKRKLGDRLEQPVYKFMTDQQLQEAYDEAKKQVEHLLQIPPVVAVRNLEQKIVSKDPALQGFDTSNFIFTDITYGIRDSERIILVRDTEGTLKEVDWQTRARMNQFYFPVAQRQVEVPKMFQDEHLENLLKRQEYNFILDRACIQFEPSNFLYQKVVTITYQCVNDNNHYDALRSTRHFGGLAFFLAWNKIIDSLLLDVIETDHIEEAKALVDLYAKIHQIKLESDENFKQVEEYIKKHSTKKGALELALQSYKNLVKRKAELDGGIRRAHGLS